VFCFNGSEEILVFMKLVYTEMVNKRRRLS
jgi:hypothetical protein